MYHKSGYKYEAQLPSLDTSFDYVETVNVWSTYSCSKRLYKARLNAMGVVWDANEGSNPSRSFRARVAGWINTLLSLSTNLNIFPYFMLVTKCEYQDSNL